MPPRGESFHQIADDPKRAWRRIARYCMHELSSYAHWAAGTAATLDYSSWRQCRGAEFDAESVRQMGIYPVMTPAEAMAECQRLGPEGVFTFHPVCGGLPPEQGWESLRIFESAVLPQLAG